MKKIDFPFTLGKAKKIISSHVNYKAEIIETKNALERYLAQNIISPENFPAFARSLYDGFAVNSKEIYLSFPRKRESILVGAGSKPALKCGQVDSRLRGNDTPPISPFEKGGLKGDLISTGHILPKGTDAVVMLEDACFPKIKIQPGQNVIFAGEDIKKGKLIFGKGWKLRPQDIGLLQGLGVKKIKVFKKFSVGIVSSGNEIVPSDKTPGYGQVRDMNSGMFFNLILRAGGEPVFSGICPDKKEAILNYINKIYKQKLDLILFTGGTSVGNSDILEDALLSLNGGKILFHGLKIRPGKTTLAGFWNGRLIIGLSGRPSSAFVVFHLLVKPILNYFYHSQNMPEAVLREDITGNSEIEEYLPVLIEQKNGTFYARPVSAKPSLFSPLIFSDGIIKIPIGQKTIKKGQAVRYFPL